VLREAIDRYCMLHLREFLILQPKSMKASVHKEQIKNPGFAITNTDFKSTSNLRANCCKRIEPRAYKYCAWLRKACLQQFL